MTGHPTTGQTRAGARNTARILILSALVIVTNVAGNAFLSIGVKAAERGAGVVWLRYFRQPPLALGVVLLISWLLLRLALLSAAEMSLVLPATAGAAYVLTSLVGQFWLSEQVSWVHNAGLVMIALGVLVLGTGPRFSTTLHRPSL